MRRRRPPLVVPDQYIPPGAPAPGRCRVCGCTDEAACVIIGPGGVQLPCAWVDDARTLCSVCQAGALVARRAPPPPAPPPPPPPVLAAPRGGRARLRLGFLDITIELGDGAPPSSRRRRRRR